MALSFSPLSAQALSQAEYVRATVLEVEAYESPLSLNSHFRDIYQQVKVKIVSGKYDGRVIRIKHMASGMLGADMILKKGDRVMLFVDENPSEAESPDGSPTFNVADYARDTPVYWLAFLYALLLVVVGGIKGLKSLVSLVLTIALIFFVFFPLVLWGIDPLSASIVIAAAVSVMVFTIIGGKSVKSLSAALGTLGGVIIAGLLASLAGRMMHLTGLSSEEAKILLYSMHINLNYQGLLFGSILIGALGAVMDVGMSIASAIDEVRRAHPRADYLNLFNAGMNVGRDVMGTMSNTLILAYTGSSLPLMLLLAANNVSAAKIINLEMIAVEVVRALAGSIGLVLCIPLTASLSALLHIRKK